MKMSRINRGWLIGIISLGILLRIGAAVYLGNSITGAQQTRIYDQVSYNALALSLLAGRGYSFEQGWYPFTPANKRCDTIPSNDEESCARTCPCCSAGKESTIR